VTAAELLDALWCSYAAATPQAARIHRLLTERGELLRNDCVALRTFGLAGLDDDLAAELRDAIGIDALARRFEALGWRPRDRYRTRDRQLRARYWQHDDPAMPKLVITELVVAELSDDAQAAIAELIRSVPPGFSARDVLWAGRPWSVTHAAYRALLAESEHAAWLAAFGFRIHHFTVDVGSLSTFPDLEALDAFLIEHGERLDDRGGAIKGSRAEWLERSATRPDLVPVEFADATVRVPTGTYEFARRYRLPSGELFHGFVPTITDRVRSI
jgi:hypothetical protein